MPEAAQPASGRTDASGSNTERSEDMPKKPKRCTVCFHADWYHRIAEALGEIDHKFQEQEDK